MLISMGVCITNKPNMKNILKPTLLVVLLSFSLPSIQNALSETPAKTIPAEKTTEADAMKMINRLEEIKAMDPSNMTRREKKEIRREVKTINSNLKTQSGGIYLSVGAIIIIILLLIILL
jgi:hypothetical protein